MRQTLKIGSLNLELLGIDAGLDPSCCRPSARALSDSPSLRNDNFALSQTKRVLFAGIVIHLVNEDL
jgi:hypothetical protein